MFSLHIPACGTSNVRCNVGYIFIQALCSSYCLTRNSYHYIHTTCSASWQLGKHHQRPHRSQSWIYKQPWHWLNRHSEITTMTSCWPHQTHNHRSDQEQGHRQAAVQYLPTTPSWLHSTEGHGKTNKNKEINTRTKKSSLWQNSGLERGEYNITSKHTSSFTMLEYNDYTLSCDT